MAKQNVKNRPILVISQREVRSLIMQTTETVVQCLYHQIQEPPTHPIVADQPIKNRPILVISQRELRPLIMQTTDTVVQRLYVLVKQKTEEPLTY
uniref:Uncharacterized protein n=1 Tax=Tanacetum cinerariifolium TaxID=118510 RepID=A0A6L2MRR8_TANCI|nr:hypothetical protein [Tanacetum cinerariifolium]